MATFQNTKIIRPIKPDRGSFPLDHESACKGKMMDYMQCIVDHDRDNKKCRAEAKEYLSCRMKNNLMAEEDWSYLGFNDESEKKN